VAISDTVRSGKPCDDVRAYIMSRKLSARRFGAAVRGHRGIENSLHWQLDMSFGEGRCRVRKDHADANMAAWRRMALGLLKNEKGKKVGITNKRLAAAWNIDYLRQVLFGA
jgi:predicted transposase YbfD/YdcC